MSAKPTEQLIDRVLHSSVHYPADYGVVLGTLGNARERAGTA